MAKKPTVTTISSGYASNTQLNANFVALRDAFDNTLSLDGSAPNALSGDLDLGGNDILNGGNIVANDIVVAGSSVAASAAAAAASAASAEASYDAFDDRYLGAKASAPAVDNDGDALTTGALYFDTTTSNMFVYTGSAWNAAYTEITGGLIPANNLSDVSNAATSLFNLGLTATAAEINTLDGITSTTAELNILDGVTASTAEINHLVGVTSSIQTQVDAKYTPVTQTTATWEAGTDTTESVVSAAKVAAAIASLGVSSRVELARADVTSSVSSVDFTAFGASLYDRYEFLFIDVELDGSVQLYAELSSDGGSSYITGGNYGGSYISTDNSVNEGGSFSAPVLRGTSTQFDGELVLTRAGSASEKTWIRYHLVNLVSTNTPRVTAGAIIRSAAEVNNALRFRPSSGNITRGVFIMYGVV